MDAPTSLEDHFYNINDRIPTLQDLEDNIKKKSMKEDRIKKNLKEVSKRVDISNLKKIEYVAYKNFGVKEDLGRRSIKSECRFLNFCFLSVCISFLLGLAIGIILMGSTQSQSPNLSPKINISVNRPNQRNLNSLKVDEKDFKIDNKIEFIGDKVDKKNRKHRYSAVSFTGDDRFQKEIYPKGLTEDMKDILKDNKNNNQKHTINNVIINNNNTKYVPNDQTVLFENIFWGPEVENSMPQGYGASSAEIWEKYVNQSEIVSMQSGCGRMQNRLVTFKDGIQACVRYRQNTDQIQGEIFSFYVGKLLNLTNLAPSVVKIVDLKDKLWQNVAGDIATAQWNSNRAVVLTQFVPSLESATIPDIFKPSNRHLNKHDVLKLSKKENQVEDKEILIEKLKTKTLKAKTDVVEDFDHFDLKLNKKTIDSFVELAQWSDLIIFDYLTANLDRIVNNLFNFQWNLNIMDGPAHNLAKKIDSGLLLFLDNESGLLHGYRLLKKYNVYHSLMLDNLCVFRKTTVNALKSIYEQQNIGQKLIDMFHAKNNAVIRDILPPLPEKNAKILHERIGKVLGQVEKCEQSFSNR